MNNVTVTKGRKSISTRPMTPAERKARQRQKDKRAMIECIGGEENAPLKALLAQVARAEQGDGAEHAAQRAWKEIGKRFGWA